MSLDAFSAENRNQMPVPLSRRRVQCCSFCRRPGHNITTCNSDRLLEFEVICADVVRNFHNTDDFKNWISQNYANEPLLLKAFAIKKYRMVIRFTSEEYIHYITEYIFRKYKNIPQLENQESENNAPELINLDTIDNLYDEYRNLLITLRNRNDVREQILEHRELEINLVRQYISYLAELGMSLVRREEVLPQTVNILTQTESNEEENLSEICQCSICWDDKELKNFVKLNCNHEFCKDCISQTLRTETRTNFTCALCRSEITSIRLRTQEVQDEIMVNINS